MGHMYVGITTKLSNIVPDLVKRANLPAGTALAIYEEIKPNMLEKVEDLDKPLEHVLEELMDGDILVFQKKTADANYRYGEKSWCFLRILLRIPVRRHFQSRHTFSARFV